MKEDIAAYKLEWTERTLCTTLEEMRTAHKVGNYSYLAGLIEEAQTYANRMESRLEDYRELFSKIQDVKKLYKELKQEKKVIESVLTVEEKHFIEEMGEEV